MILASITRGKIKRENKRSTVRYVTGGAHTSDLPANLIPLTMCTRRNLLTSLSRLMLFSPILLSLSLFFSFSFFHGYFDHYRDRHSRTPMSVVNGRIYRFWIWGPSPVPRGNLSASPRNLALITAIYSSPPSMTSLRIRVIEAPIREFARSVSRRDKRYYSRRRFVKIAFLREQFCAIN